MSSRKQRKLARSAKRPRKPKLMIPDVDPVPDVSAPIPEAAPIVSDLKQFLDNKEPLSETSEKIKEEAKIALDGKLEPKKTNESGMNAIGYTVLFFIILTYLILIGFAGGYAKHKRNGGELDFLDYVKYLTDKIFHNGEFGFWKMVVLFKKLLGFLSEEEKTKTLDILAERHQDPDGMNPDPEMKLLSRGADYSGRIMKEAVKLTQQREKREILSTLSTLKDNPIINAIDEELANDEKELIAIYRKGMNGNLVIEGYRPTQEDTDRSHELSAKINIKLAEQKRREEERKRQEEERDAPLRDFEERYARYNYQLGEANRINSDISYDRILASNRHRKAIMPQKVP